MARHDYDYRWEQASRGHAGALLLNERSTGREVDSEAELLCTRGTSACPSVVNVLSFRDKSRQGHNASYVHQAHVQATIAEASAPKIAVRSGAPNEVPTDSAAASMGASGGTVRVLPATSANGMLISRPPFIVTMRPY